MRPIVSVVAVVIAFSVAPSAASAVHFCRGERATIVGTADKDKLNGTAGRDVIVALDGHDVVHGGRGDDLICLGESKGPAAFVERGYGDKGDDVVLGGPGRESLYGGRGNDHLGVGPGRRNVAVGGPGRDELVGGPGSDLLGGEGGPVSGETSAGGGYEWAHIPGEPGNDGIRGGAGDDVLVNGEGDDDFDGGRGIDRVVYWATEGGDYSADLETGRARGGGRDGLRRVEDLQAWTRGDVLLRGDDRPNVLVGLSLGESGTATFYGERGDDLLAAHSGRLRRSDYDLYGGHGNDALVDECDLDDELVDDLFAGPGADEIILGCGLRHASAGPGDDTIVGMGGAQDDIVNHDGGPGFDMLVFDVAYGGVEADLLAGTLTMHFEDGSTGHTHTLLAIEGVQGGDGYDDVILGDEGSNVLMGGISQLDEVDDDDRIEGRGGDDEISGDDGNDDLDGGDGDDTIDGGEGVDRCRNGESVNGCELT